MKNRTIYSFAHQEMAQIVADLLTLAHESDNFAKPPADAWKNVRMRELLLCGKGYDLGEVATLVSPENAWTARLALPFSVELAATATLHKQIQAFTDELIMLAYSETHEFSEVSPDWIAANPHFLPVLMHVTGTFSKQALKKQIGSASDHGISRPAAERISNLLQTVSSSIPEQGRVRERMKATAEGIVRDLVGRLLLEEFVAASLNRHGVPFKRENEYDHLTGVIYDFRADFVIPGPDTPLAFVEVRKSSSRHASLYAKDKMFSAINWKGRHERCVGVLVVDGAWTEVTLRVLTRVFDYVVPLAQVDEVAAKIRSYLDGDSSVLRWLVRFSILQNVREAEPTDNTIP